MGTTLADQAEPPDAALRLLDAAEHHILLRAQAYLGTDRVDDGAQRAAQPGVVAVTDASVLDVEAEKPASRTRLLPAQVVLDGRPGHDARILEPEREPLLNLAKNIFFIRWAARRLRAEFRATASLGAAEWTRS